ncbi:MAG: archaemetzincin family Zn-dependent metalloprotease [Archaeoglobaceae archaeon]
MISLQPLGKVDSELLKWLARELEKKFDIKVETNLELEIPKTCFDVRRGQYNSTCILMSFRVKNITLFITAEDIYADELNFIFGEAEIGGKKAIVSFYRLKSQDYELFKQRLLKESVHELGHVFGLSHCKKKGCVMNFSPSVIDVDKKTENFCEDCLKKLKKK